MNDSMIHLMIIVSTLVPFIGLLFLLNNPTIKSARLSEALLSIPCCVQGAIFNECLRVSLMYSRKMGLTPTQMVWITLLVFKARLWHTVKDEEEAVSLIPEFSRALQYHYDNGMKSIRVFWNENLDFCLEHGLRFIIDLESSMERSVPIKFNDSNRPLDQDDAFREEKEENWQRNLFP